MQRIFSIPIDKHSALNCIRVLAGEMECDILLSDTVLRDDTSFMVGINPVEIKRIQPNISKAEIAEFAFSDRAPTFGFLSYEYGVIKQCPHLENAIQKKNGKFPWGCLKKYACYLFYDKKESCLSGLTVVSSKESPGVRTAYCNHIKRNLERIIRDSSCIKGFVEKPFSGIPPQEFCEVGQIQQSLAQATYEEKVCQCINHIAAGDAYQLTLSIHFRRQLNASDYLPSSLFFDLFRRYPAPYYSYFNALTYSILFCTPECFLNVKDGRVITKPIKGTRKIGNDKEADILVLRASSKEDAELSMIVDLMRNDIAMHCKYGSIRLLEHKSIFQVDKLLQMYSVIEGQLMDDSSVVDLLFDAFPPGSVTGCPKKRALEMIDVLEPHPRHAYCGSPFVIFDKKNMNASVAIRTAYFDSEDNSLHFYAGSGITMYSDPLLEYQETLAKAEKMIYLSN